MPGDKSISHRVAMLSSIALGDSTITGFASSADCSSTLDCLRRLGVVIEQADGRLVIRGRGLRGYRPAALPVRLDAGNSGSTIRMLAGLLAGQRFQSEIDGDQSLARRPMRRIIDPLALMGARLHARGGTFTPLHIEGGMLKPITYASPVASAQVKTCVLFAGLYAEGRTIVTEPAQSRNHTELMLREFGAKFDSADRGHIELSIEGGGELQALDYHVPGDPSSACFFIAAAAILPDSDLRVSGINLNPTRTAFIEVLRQLGANIAEHNVRLQHGESIGDLHVTGSRLREGETLLRGAVIPNLIDELPMLAVAATQLQGRLEVRDAGELRVKESDRLRTVANGIRALGGQVEEFDDGFVIEGPQRLKGARVETAGDHRIAMAFSIAALVAEGTTLIANAESAAVSFPEFYDLLSAVTEAGTVEYE